MKINEKIGGLPFPGLPPQFWRIMKITVLIITVFLIHVSASTKAQITLKEKGAPLQKVLEAISKQGGYDLVYSDLDFKNAKPVTVNLNNVSVETALQVAFQGQALTYEVSEKTVMVRKKQDKTVLDRVKDYFNGRDVTGIVLDEKGQPLPGATVKLKNGSKSTIADEKGFFMIKDLNEDDILVVSFIGYKSKDVAINSDLTIRLELSSSQLDVVQIEAYSKSSKRSSVNDITTVKGADFENHPLDNPLKALEGRVPGLIVTPASGMPGAAMTLQLRGQNSLAGPLTQPLIVLDGVPITNNIQNAGAVNIDQSNSYRTNISSLSFINPADIESIDVLKDADATSIYGSKGANGVILITTKKGKAGDTKITVSSYTGYSRMTKEIAMMNTQQYLQMRKDAYLADGNPVPTDPYDHFELTLWDQNRNTDWQKTLLGKKAFFTSNNASISGGNALVQYMVGGSFNKQTYVFPGQGKYESGGAHFSITGASPNQKFRASLTGGYTANKNIASYDQTGIAVDMLPNAPALRKANGELNWEPAPTGYATWDNPLAVQANENYAEIAMLYSSLDLSYKISPSLMIKTTAGVTNTDIRGFNDKTIASQDPAAVATNTGRSLFSNNSSGSWSVEPQLLYNHAIGRGLLNIIVGASLEQRRQFNQSIAGIGYTNDALLHNLASAGSFDASDASVQYRSEGIYARATYNWGDKYLLSINARRDGSSRFGAGNQFGNFASGGLGWIFSNEPFIKKALPFVSFGKLRFSVGTSGNDGIGDYEAIGYYKQLGGAGGGAFGFGDPVITYQGIKTIYSQGPNNPNFHWETVTKMVWGFDVGVFNDRIVITGNYFRNRSSNQLSLINLPATAGGGNITVNLPAKIQNMGGDLSISTRNVIGKNFTWSTSGTIAFLRNKLLSLPSDNYQSYFPALYYYRSRKESPVGKAFAGVASVYEFRGVDPATGVYQFTGADGKPTAFTQANADARLVNINPQFDGGLGNTFTYKNFKLDVFLQYIKRNGLNYLYQANSPLGADLGNITGNVVTHNEPEALVNYWKKPGDMVPIQRISAQGYYIDPNTGTFYDLNGAQATVKNSTAAYTDASFIRVKSITFSYSIPEAWRKKMGVRSLTFSLSGENLWTITGYKGADPETQDIHFLPPLRTITAGFNIGL